MNKANIKDGNNINENQNYKRLVIDIDGTICAEKDTNTKYSDVKPNQEIIKRIKEYKENGFYIILYTSRQMRTYNNNIGKIIPNTIPPIIDWLKRYEVPYDEILIGKPWCGYDGFYIDDKAIRPDEFINKSYDEIRVLIGKK